MRLTLALICAVCVCTLASAIPTERDSELLWKKQKLVLDVLQHFPQNNIFSEEYTKLASEFKWENYAEKFGPNSKFLIEEIKSFWKQGLLNFKSFAVSRDEQEKPAMALYRMFYFAEDFETFEAVVWWARLYVNPGLFGYIFGLTLVQRPDMFEVVMPPHHEIFPFMFYGANVIDDARKFQLHQFKDDKYEFFVTANYTSLFYSNNKEAILDYYREDVGLNSFYYYSQLDNPSWMNYTEFDRTKARRGELFLYQMHNLLARYTLERFSNGLGEIPKFSVYEPIATGYNSMLRYYNGVYFPVRNSHYNLYKSDNLYNVDSVVLMSQRIADAIDLGYVELADGTHIDLTKPESINVLGNLIQANPESLYPRYFKSVEKMAKNLLRGSGAVLNQGSITGVLDWSMTAMRDPMFYQMYQKLMRHYRSFKKHLPSYTNEELFYDNVKFDSVEVSKLTTFFEQFESDLTNAVDIEVLPATGSIETAPLFNFGRRSLYKNHDLHIKATQMRLNHDHFTFTYKLNAIKPAKVLIKTFLGPKNDELGNSYTYEEMHEHFFALDEQVVDLEAGINTIIRDCSEFPGYSHKRSTYFELYEKMMKKEAISWPLETGTRGFPGRLMLPKGWKSGMPVKFFFYVMPYTTDFMEKFDYNGFKFAFNKHQSFGFPIDRPINHFQWKMNPGNMYSYDTVIYHM